MLHLSLFLLQQEIMSSLKFTKTSQDMNLARQIFLKATNSVLPQIRLRQILQFDGNNLHIENSSYQIPKT